MLKEYTKEYRDCLAENAISHWLTEIKCNSRKAA